MSLERHCTRTPRLTVLGRPSGIGLIENSTSHTLAQGRSERYLSTKMSRSLIMQPSPMVVFQRTILLGDSATLRRLSPSFELGLPTAVVLGLCRFVKRFSLCQ